MSDTQKLILWIVIAVIVIAIVAWILVSSARRRQAEEQRRQAGSLRAQAKAQRAGVTQAADRASVTQQMAAEARTDADESRARADRAMEEARAQAAEAERKSAEAERVAGVAESSQAEASRVQASHDDLLREADRVDPDVETPDEERAEAPADEARHEVPDEDAADEDAADEARSDEARHDGSDEVSDKESAAGGDEAAHHTGRASAVGVGSAAGAVAAGGIRAGSFDDDEPDMADAENPFASTDDAQSEPVADPGLGGATTSEQGRPDDVPEDVPGGVSEGLGRDDKGAGDTRGTRPGTPNRDDEDSNAFAAGGGSAEENLAGHETGPSDDDGDWVNGPFDEESVDDRPVDDVVDWINGPSDDESVTMDVPDESTTPAVDPVAAAAAGGARDVPDETATPTSEIIDKLPEGVDSPSGSDDDAPAHSERRISALDEVRDGGYGVGSAAPIDDGAQPLGHPVKAVRDGDTYLVPGSEGYDDIEPDVWFLDERAARAAGYHPSTDD